MFADIALPNAVREVFTYAVKTEMAGQVSVGKRVWVPLGRRKVIGMVVRVHQNKPDFTCKYVSDVLDAKPLLSDELLRLSEWVGKYYFAGWGEVIQAMLPSGLNYVADRYLVSGDSSKLTGKQSVIFDEIDSIGSLKLEEAEKRWGVGVIRQMIQSGGLELIERPKLKITPKMQKAFSWSDEQREKAVSFAMNWSGKKTGWVESIHEIMTLSPPVPQTALVELHGISPYSLRKIEKEGFIDSVRIEKDENPEKALEHNPDRIKSLNAQQSEALESIVNALNSSVFQSFLLYGITGSGKTEVYIHALKAALDAGKGGLILVPEIALTPQTVRRFYEIFGDEIAVLHSRLNDRERFEAWNALKKGEKTIAIGARSAVFAPVQNPGIIIIDEEHDQSYKQEDPAPRYHAREVAIMRASMLGIPVVLGSATPFMGTLHGVSRGKHKILKLQSRHEEAQLPEVQVLDLRQYRGGMWGPLAAPLYQAIVEALSKNEQVILLHNRRGFASYQQCESCGHVPECPHCSVSLTYHQSNRTLRCHYCGFSRSSPQKCEKCDEPGIGKKGSGTQRIEEEIAEIFPKARISRMDRDTTSRRDAHAKILNAFGKGESDILIGTQLVAKGLDFPNVTVVGVVNADTELAFPSYRSGERMFQLLTQVAGRSGRAQKKGRVFLQTRIPEHPSLLFASNHDFEGFAKYEMQSRKQLFYPPYSRVIQFHFKSEDDIKVMGVANLFTDTLASVMNSNLTDRRKFAILGPAPSAIAKLYDDFRWETMLKLDLNIGVKAIEQLLERTFAEYDKQKPAGSSTVRINVNVDG